jgi:hypothetical protein
MHLVRSWEASRLLDAHVTGSITINQGGKNDGFVEFGDADLCIGWIDGIWHPGSIRHSSHRFCFPSATTAPSASQVPTRNRARNVKAGIRFPGIRAWVCRRLPAANPENSPSGLSRIPAQSQSDHQPPLYCGLLRCCISMICCWRCCISCMICCGVRGGIPGLNPLRMLGGTCGCGCGCG